MDVSNGLRVKKTVSATSANSQPANETVLGLTRFQYSRSLFTLSGRHLEVSGWPRGTAEAASIWYHTSTRSLTVNHRLALAGLAGGSGSISVRKRAAAS